MNEIINVHASFYLTLTLSLSLSHLGMMRELNSSPRIKPPNNRKLTDKNEKPTDLPRKSHSQVSL